MIRNGYSLSNLVNNKFIIYSSVVKEMKMNEKKKLFLINDNIF